MIGERVLKGVGATAIGHGISVGQTVLLVPIFLRSWGIELYGEWLVLSAAVAHLALLDFGVQTYVINRLCQSYATARMEEFHRDLHAALRMFVLVSLAGVLGLTMLLVVTSVSQLLNLNAIGRMTAGLTVFILGVNVLFNSIPMGLIGGIYRATGSYARGQMIGNMLRLVHFSLTILIVTTSRSPVLLVLVWVAANIVGITVILIDLHRHRPGIRISLTTGSLAHGCRLCGPSLLFLLMMLASTVNTQGTVLVLNGFVGAVAVVAFTTTRTLSNVVTQLVGMITSAAWPEVTALAARKENILFGRLWHSVVKLSVSTAVLSALILYLVGGAVYEVWTGRELVFDPLLFGVMLIQVVLQAFWNSAGLPLIATNRLGGYAGCMLGNSILTLVMSVTLVERWGAVGVAIASLAADVVCSAVVVPWLAARTFGVSVRRVLGEGVAAPVIIGAFLLIIGGWLDVSNVGVVWRVLVLPVTAISLFGVMLYALGLDTMERSVVRRLGRRLAVAVQRV